MKTFEQQAKSRKNAECVATWLVNELVKDPKYRSMLEGIATKYRENDSDFLMALGGYIGCNAKYAIETLQVKY